jgi:hypothetical protein
MTTGAIQQNKWQPTPPLLWAPVPPPPVLHNRRRRAALLVCLILLRAIQHCSGYVF